MKNGLVDKKQNKVQNVFSTKINSTNNDLINYFMLNDDKMPKIIINDSDTLDLLITIEELYNNIVEMSKTSGCDGIPIEFYLAFWPKIGQILYDSILFSLVKGEFSNSQREGIISLFSKRTKTLQRKSCYFQHLLRYESYRFGII